MLLIYDFSKNLRKDLQMSSFVSNSACLKPIQLYYLPGTIHRFAKATF